MDDDQHDPTTVHVVEGIGNEPLPDFRAIARVIQNRTRRRVGAGSTEVRLFREFFGTSLLVVELVWKLIVQGKHLPQDGRPEHLMWCLHFLKVYPKQGPGCSAVGGSERGAVDPRTHRKWVWAFIEAVERLSDLVVSIAVYFLCNFFVLVVPSCRSMSDGRRTRRRSFVRFFVCSFIFKRIKITPLTTFLYPSPPLSRNHRSISTSVSASTT